MNSSKLFLSAAAIAAVLGLQSCIIHVDANGVDTDMCWNEGSSGTVHRGSGIVATETRTVADFHRIELRGSADVRARVASERTLSVTSDDNLLQYIHTEVRNGTLFVELDSGRYEFHSGLKLDLSVPVLDGIEIAGSSDVVLTDMSGPRLVINVSGSGDVDAKGHVDALEATVSGSGDLDLSGLAAKTARAQVSGSGDIALDVSERLDVSISGSGDVRYSGTAQLNSRVSGSGSVSHR
jgi:hypothetical protein